MTTKTRITVRAGLSVAAASAAATSYSLLFRRRSLTWGTRPAEAARRLPGDDLLATADIVSPA